MGIHLPQGRIKGRTEVTSAKLWGQLRRACLLRVLQSSVIKCTNIPAMGSEHALLSERTCYDWLHSGFLYSCWDRRAILGRLERPRRRRSEGLSQSLGLGSRLQHGKFRLQIDYHHHLESQRRLQTENFPWSLEGARESHDYRVPLSRNLQGVNKRERHRFIASALRGVTPVSEAKRRTRQIISAVRSRERHRR